MSQNYLLYEYYTGHCPLSEVYLIYMTFQELALPPSSAACHYKVKGEVVPVLLFSLN